MVLSDRFGGIRNMDRNCSKMQLHSLLFYEALILIDSSRSWYKNCLNNCFARHSTDNKHSWLQFHHLIEFRMCLPVHPPVGLDDQWCPDSRMSCNRCWQSNNPYGAASCMRCRARYHRSASVPFCNRDIFSRYIYSWFVSSEGVVCGDADGSVPSGCEVVSASGVENEAPGVGSDIPSLSVSASASLPGCSW